MTGELAIAGLSVGYIVVCVLAAELVYRARLVTQTAATRLAQIAATGWILFAYFGIDNPFVAAAVPGVFVPLSLLPGPGKQRPSFLRPRLKILETEEGTATPWRVLVPLTTAVIVLAFWLWLPGYRFVAVISLLAAGCAAPAAALMDHNYGRYIYRVLGKNRSLEGTATMFLITFISASAIMPTTKVGSGFFLPTSLCAALTATAADNTSPALSESFAVPVGTAVVLLWWVLAF